MRLVCEIKDRVFRFLKGGMVWVANAHLFECIAILIISIRLSLVPISALTNG